MFIAALLFIDFEFDKIHWLVLFLDCTVYFYHEKLSTLSNIDCNNYEVK